jgi:predicted dehydrogenase
VKKRLRGAVIGYGFIASKGHIPAYLNRQQKQGDVEIVAIADISPLRRASAAVALPTAHIYSDYLELLEKESSDLDFIDIAVPPRDHFKMASEALTRGLHVLCEKPLTTSIQEAKLILETAKNARRVIFPCHNYRHAPVIKAIDKIIESGRLGKIKSVSLITFRNTHAKGVHEWEKDWRRHTKWSGGGIAMDHGSHSFYLAFNWLKSYPTSITAKISNLQPEKYDTEDNLNCVLSFPTGVANIQLSWTAGVRKVIYALQGELGGITVDDDDMEISIIKPTSGADVAQGAVTWHNETLKISSDWMDASHLNWFDSLFEEFKTAIENDQFAGKQALDAQACVETINAAYLSASDKSREIEMNRAN